MKREISEQEREAREQNRRLSAIAVLACLKAEQPQVWEAAEVVGAWVWVSFKDKPSQEVRDYLLHLGFHWNRERLCWQHCGGKPSTHSNGDPRSNYGSMAASELEIGRLLTA